MRILQTVCVSGMDVAAAAKSLQSCPTLCDPIDGSPPGSPVPGILQARTLEWAAGFLLQCMKVKSESEVAQSCLTPRDPMDCSLPGSSGPWDFPGKSTGVGCHCLLRHSVSIGHQKHCGDWLWARTQGLDLLLLKLPSPRSGHQWRGEAGPQWGREQADTVSLGLRLPCPSTIHPTGVTMQTISSPCLSGPSLSLYYW